MQLKWFLKSKTKSGTLKKCSRIYSLIFRKSLTHVPTFTHLLTMCRIHPCPVSRTSTKRCKGSSSKSSKATDTAVGVGSVVLVKSVIFNQMPLSWSITQGMQRIRALAQSLYNAAMTIMMRWPTQWALEL